MNLGDWCTSDGARRLKSKIEAYWRERGYDVDVTLVGCRLYARNAFGAL